MNKVNEWINAHADELIDAAARLVRINSVGGERAGDHPFGDGVAAAMDEVCAIAAEWGFSTRNHEYYVVTAQLGEGEPTLGILGHLDTVPEGKNWSVPPFCGEVRDGRLFGRGAIDDKGPVAAALFAMRAIKECGITLQSPCRCIMGGDEETGSTDMEYYRTKEAFPPFVFSPDGNFPVINAEKGRVQLAVTAPVADRRLVSAEGGTVINAVPTEARAVLRDVSIETLEEAIRRTGHRAEAAVREGHLEVLTFGVAAHGSTPALGQNAVTALLEILAAAGIGGEAVAEAARRFPFAESGGESAGVACSDEQSGPLTLALTLLTVENGTFCGKADIRFPVTKTVAEIQEKLTAGLGDAFAVTFAHTAESHLVSADTPFVQTLLRVYEQETGQKGECIAIGGGTYVHEIENGVAFGAEFPGTENNMHGADESMSVEDLLANARIMAAAIMAVCGVKEL